MQTLAQNAIQAALDCAWEKAVKINLEILSQDSNNVDALNRLSKAYFELGKITKAKKCCKKALDIDELNVIASKNLEKFTHLKPTQSNGIRLLNPHVFLEQPGKTKIVELIHISDKISPADFDPGTEVKVHSGNFRVSIFTRNGQYIGKFTDDISRTIIKNVNNDLQYSAWIKDSAPGRILVFIKQEMR
ncbi:MAG: tetratricopeptide repeat protein [Chloroflexota bacterium]